MVAENAARLCDSDDAQIDASMATEYDSLPSTGRSRFRIEEGRPIIRGLASGRAILDRETIHIPDTFASNVETEFPETWAMAHEIGIRTMLATPLLREGCPSDTS